MVYELLQHRGQLAGSHLELPMVRSEGRRDLAGIGELVVGAEPGEPERERLDPVRGVA